MGPREKIEEGRVGKGWAEYRVFDDYLSRLAFGLGIFFVTSGKVTNVMERERRFAGYQALTPPEKVAGSMEKQNETICFRARHNITVLVSLRKFLAIWSNNPQTRTSKANSVRYD